MTGKETKNPSAPAPIIQSGTLITGDRVISTGTPEYRTITAARAYKSRATASGNVQTAESLEAGVHYFPKIGIAVEIPLSTIRRGVIELNQRRGENTLPMPVSPELDVFSECCRNPMDPATAIGWVTKVETVDADSHKGISITIRRGEKDFGKYEVVPEIEIKDNVTEDGTVEFGGKTLKKFIIHRMYICGFADGGKVDGDTTTPDEPRPPRPENKSGNEDGNGNEDGESTVLEAKSEVNTPNEDGNGNEDDEPEILEYKSVDTIPEGGKVVTNESFSKKYKKRKGKGGK